MTAVAVSKATAPGAWTGADSVFAAPPANRQDAVSGGPGASGATPVCSGPPWNEVQSVCDWAKAVAPEATATRRRIAKTPMDRRGRPAGR